VVDNNSQDGTEVLMRERLSWVNYIRHRENYGTARGFNRGIAESGDAAYTFLMNDDVELLPQTFHDMMETLKQYHRARGIAANLMYPDGSPQRVKLGVVGLSRLKNSRIRSISFPGTTACLYHTEVFHRVGLFDEFYFFYNEDLDFAVRAKRAGIQFICNPNIKVIHHGYMGRLKGERFVKPHAFSADYYFYRKNYGWLAASLYLCAARLRLKRKKRAYDRQKDKKQLQLLEMGIQNLEETVRRFRTSFKGEKS
jgi:GT2 family glycosyltransferase